MENSSEETGFAPVSESGSVACSNYLSCLKSSTSDVADVATPWLWQRPCPRIILKLCPLPYSSKCYTETRSSCLSEIVNCSPHATEWALSSPSDDPTLQEVITHKSIFIFRVFFFPLIIHPLCNFCSYLAQALLTGIHSQVRLLFSVTQDMSSPHPLNWSQYFKDPLSFRSLSLFL